MEQANISSKQLFVLMFLFQLGSAIVVAPGMEAKQDAWIAILLGMTTGMGTFLMYAYLYKQYPDVPLTQYAQKLLGKDAGRIIALLYILYFLYLSSRVLRDFGELLKTSILKDTPLSAILLLMIMTVVWGAYMGIEVLGRTGAIMFAAMAALILFFFLAIILSDAGDINNLLPILENGWKPVLQATFPLTFTFPFGELIVFTFLLPYVNEADRAIRFGLLSIVISGLVLSATIAMNIAVLGVMNASVQHFPLLATVSRISIGEVLQRLDVVAISALILGGFFKIVIFFYAGMMGLKDLFRIEKRKQTAILCIVIGLLVFAYAMRMASSFAEHIEIGLQLVPYYLHLPFQAGLPLLLVLIACLKQRKQQRSS